MASMNGFRRPAPPGRERGRGQVPGPGGNLAASAVVHASYTSPWESTAAVNDGMDPPSSNDATHPRWATWPHTGEQWVALTWPTAQIIRTAQVYFFDDNGGVRVPASWRVQHWNGSAYVDVTGASGYPVATNRYNQVAFDRVSTTRLRVLLQCGTASVGLLEVRASSWPHRPTARGAPA